MNLSTSANRRLLSSVHKLLREDDDRARDVAADRVYAQLLDVESMKILADVQQIMNGNDSAAEKLRAIADILLDAQDDEDEDAATKVQLAPRSSD
jgi:hypothetical protein